ncbi:MAG: hypothetical protein ABII13_01080 [Patescibacteria group bacterium]|nr:hypothetical protein [Patescibacteria group bacterium]MBU2509392.1 hypothetical protein [Patescibacteria group bacterium]
MSKTQITQSDSKNSATICTQLQEWAHSGTKESIEKIKNVLSQKNNKEVEITAELAYDEALYFYYSTSNEQEERDFLLAKMIHEKEEPLWKLECKIGAAKLELQKLELDKAVNNAIMSDESSNLPDDWKYRFSKDYYMTVKHRLLELEDELAYNEFWIKIAKELIKSDKFKNIPPRVFEGQHWNYEDVCIWGDFDELDDLEDLSGLDDLLE